MRYVKPHFYDDFKCIADKCPDTCCAGWQIVIDDDTLERYSTEKNGGNTAERRIFQKRLENSIDWQEGCFYQYNGRCAMLNDRNLCDLVIERGEEWLCDTCNRYPRHIEEFEGLREMSLSLSCPVAAELILKETNPVHFLIEEDEEDDPLGEEFEDFDLLLFTQLEDARAVLFQIIQNRELPVELRMQLAIRMAYQMQECLDEQRLFDMDEVISSFAGELTDLLSEVTKAAKYGEERFLQLLKGYEVFYKLERLREEWTQVLAETSETLYARGYEHYSEIYEAFSKEYCFEEARRMEWECFLEQLLMFFLYTYFCGAVYDDCIYSKVALAVFSVTYLQEFIMCQWYLNGETADKQEWIRMSYRYAREVEHSDDNLNMLEEWLMETM